MNLMIIMTIMNIMNITTNNFYLIRSQLSDNILSLLIQNKYQYIYSHLCGIMEESCRMFWNMERGRTLWNDW